MCIENTSNLIPPRPAYRRTTVLYSCLCFVSPRRSRESRRVQEFRRVRGLVEMSMSFYFVHGFT